MADIADILAEAGAVFSVESAQSNPVMVDASAEMRHWLCRLEAADAELEFTVSYEGDGVGVTPPSVEEAVGILVADVVTLNGAPSDEDWLARVSASEASGDVRSLWLATRSAVERYAADLGRVIGVERLRALCAPENLVEAEPAPAI